MKETGPKKRFVAKYVRVSSLKQAMANEGSLDTQEDLLEQLINIKNSNRAEEWCLYDTYREEGKSGKNLDRPEFQRMVRDIESGLVDIVVVTKIDRITRSLKDFYDLWEFFQDNGVEFVSLNEQFDTTSPMGRFALKQLLLFAELEREVTSDRTKEKMQWRATQGLWNGNRVIGYKIDPKNKGVLIPNKEEAKLIEEMFKACIRLGSAGKTRDWLNVNGYRTPVYESRNGITHGGRKFNKQTVINILTNPVYLGKIKFHDEEFDGRHEAIITKELFDSVQDVLGVNRNTRRNPYQVIDHAYLLKGLLRCGKCGALMVPASANGRSSKRYHYYQCNKRSRIGKIECDQKMIPADKVEDGVLRFIKMIAYDKEKIDSVIAHSCEANIKMLYKLKKDQGRKQKVLNQLIEERKSYVASIAKLGPAGAEAVADNLEKVQLDINSMKEQLNNIKSEISDIEKKTINADVVAKTLKSFAQIIDGAEKEELQRLIPTVLKGAEISENAETGEGHLEVYLWEEAQELVDINRFKQKKDEPNVKPPVRPSVKIGSPGRTRTSDTVVNSHLLCQLSY